jgi:polysaccharide export outer membrane protein
MTISRSNVRKLRFALTHIFVIAGLAFGVIAQEQPSQSTEPAKTTQNSPQVGAFDAVTQKDAAITPDSSLRIGSGDLLEFSVYNVPELSTKTRISSNGDAYLPLIDYVHVGGLTVEEAQTIVEKKLSDGGFVKDPHVTLFVDQFASQGISLLGEVAKPGVYPVLGQQRLYDVISAAGGLSDKAGRSVTITHRNQQDKPIVVELARNIADSPEHNVQVYPGDTIIVRKADIVYVVGDVARPSGFLMDRGGLTVLQAVALAGGTTQTSKLNGAKIIRKTDAGMSETPIELKKILEAKAQDIPMSADDILFVPSSTRKIVGKRGIDAAIQMALAVSIVAVRP